MSSAQPNLYARQFIAGPKATSVPNLSERQSFAGSFTVGCHTGLTTTRASAGETELLCLGQLIDPGKIEHRNVDVLGEVATRALSFAALEAELARLGGRWLLFARIGDELRLYPDAVGTKSAFYTMTPNEGLWVGSQPGVLVDGIGIEPDGRLWSRFLGAPHADSWPAALTPYVGVRQLLPNHYLDLRSGEARRFWPSRPVPAREVNEAAGLMGEMLHNMIAALLNRGTVAMSMTAGYDTRTLFACAGTLREQMRFFVLSDPAVAWHDVWVPRKVTRRFGCVVDVIRTKPFDEAFWSTLQRNVGGLWWDPNDHRIYSFSAVPSRFLILSLMSEVTRCFHYKTGTHPPFVTPELLASMARYPGNPVAIESFSRWLAGVPVGTNINTLDLFFAENRLGNWASMLFTAMDAVTDVVNPYNCRELLEVGLGVDVTYRCAPYVLHQRMCELAAPGTLLEPFNHMRSEDVYARLAEWIPWRLRAGALRALMRAYGFEWPRRPSPTRG